MMIVMMVHHRNIVGIKEIIQDDFSLIVVSELCEGGDLYDRLIDIVVTMDEDTAAYVIQ